MVDYNVTYPQTKQMLRSSFDGRNSITRFHPDINNLQKHIYNGRMSFKDIHDYYDAELRKCIIHDPMTPR